MQLCGGQGERRACSTQPTGLGDHYTMQTLGTACPQVQPAFSQRRSDQRDRVPLRRHRVRPRALCRRHQLVSRAGRQAPRLVTAGTDRLSPARRLSEDRLHRRPLGSECGLLSRAWAASVQILRCATRTGLNMRCTGRKEDRLTQGVR